jgi:hypothetical protein
MSRRRRSDDSSLELLLDTICNTFGGVLFLAMLVSLMLTQTQRRIDAQPATAAPAVSAADLVRLETRAAEASREFEALEEQVRQARRTAGDFEVVDAESLLDAMEAAEHRARETESRRARLLASVAGEQAAAARSSAAKEANERDWQALAERARRARERLDAALKEREQLVAAAIRIRDDEARRSTVETTGRPPKMRETRKAEFALLLRYGRLYLIKKLVGGEQVVNEEDFMLSPGLIANVAEAKPHAGIDLTTSEGRDAGLRRVTGSFLPERWYACLVVHPDSFEEYLTAKNWLVARGYEIRLIPSDKPVRDTGADDVQVQ